jgi:hypothetical protein
MSVRLILTDFEMKQRLRFYTSPLVLSTILIMALAAFLVGSGITGMFVLNEPTVKPACATDNECTGGEVCCPFYGQSAGVCHAQEMCGPILELTRGERESNEAILNDAPAQQKFPAPPFLVLIGSAIFVLAAIVVYHHSRHESHQSAKDHPH